MAFDDLPPQPMAEFSPAARAYAEQVLALSRRAVAASRTVPDVAYGQDYWQKLDLYLPEDDGLRDLPVLLFLHGGGWTHGYKEWMGFMAPALVALPAIFVSVSYRLAPAVRYPAPLDDTIAALGWAWRNIERFGGSPDRLFLGGHSAGGHLSSLATLRRDLAAAAGLPDGVVKGCLPVSTTFRFETGQLEAMGKPLLPRPEDAAEASPLNHVAGNRVPFYITWGSADFDRVRTTSAAMVAALAAEGARVEHDILDGLDHFQSNLDLPRQDGPWLRRVRSWLAATAG